MQKHKSDPKRLIAEEDALWAARAEAAEAEGGYLGPEKSIKALRSLLNRSPSAGKRRRKLPKRW